MKALSPFNPDYAGEAYLKLGQLYRNAQNYEKEMDVYQKALSASKQGNLTALNCSLIWRILWN